MYVCVCGLSVKQTTGNMHWRVCVFVVGGESGLGQGKIEMKRNKLLDDVRIEREREKEKEREREL